MYTIHIEKGALTMKKRSVIAVVLSIVLLFAFTACGSSEPTTLESYFDDNPAEKEQLVEAIAGTDGKGVVDISADISGNVFTITGTYTQTYPEEYFGAMQEAFDKQIGEYTEEIAGEKEKIGDATGINADDITIRMVYCNGDGTEIWSKDL